MLRKGHSGLYKAPKMEEERGRLGERETGSSLLILYLKNGKLYDPGKEEGNVFYESHILGMNDDFLGNIRESQFITHNDTFVSFIQHVLD